MGWGVPRDNLSACKARMGERVIPAKPLPGLLGPSPLSPDSLGSWRTRLDGSPGHTTSSVGKPAGGRPRWRPAPVLGVQERLLSPRRTWPGAPFSPEGGSCRQERSLLSPLVKDCQSAPTVYRRILAPHPKAPDPKVSLAVPTPPRAHSLHLGLALIPGQNWLLWKALSAWDGKGPEGE